MRKNVLDESYIQMSRIQVFLLKYSFIHFIHLSTHPVYDKLISIIIKRIIFKIYFLLKDSSLIIYKLLIIYTNWSTIIITIFSIPARLFEKNRVHANRWIDKWWTRNWKNGIRGKGEGNEAKRRLQGCVSCSAHRTSAIQRKKERREKGRKKARQKRRTKKPRKEVEGKRSFTRLTFSLDTC